MDPIVASTHQVIVAGGHLLNQVLQPSAVNSLVHARTAPLAYAFPHSALSNRIAGSKKKSSVIVQIVYQEIFHLREHHNPF